MGRPLFELTPVVRWRPQQIQTVEHAAGSKDSFMACSGRHDWTLRFDQTGDANETRASCGPAQPCLPTTSNSPARWVFKVSMPLLVCDNMASHFGGTTPHHRVEVGERSTAARLRSLSSFMLHSLTALEVRLMRDWAMLAAAEPVAPSVIHLVRDPYDTAISSYLYHSQVTPRREGCRNHPGFRVPSSRVLSCPTDGTHTRAAGSHPGDVGVQGERAVPGERAKPGVPCRHTGHPGVGAQQRDRALPGALPQRDARREIGEELL